MPTAAAFWACGRRLGRWLPTSSSIALVRGLQALPSTSALPCRSGAGASNSCWPARPTRCQPGLPWLIDADGQVHVRPDVDGGAQVGGFLGRDETVDPD